MDGYSVTEAASILGVPTERVWELLARGVLAGAPDGETGMRVYLQPRSATASAPVGPPAAASEAPPRTEPQRELSPFRELLTEFRNLTERYGQALLALGEARGEVAALRSRVDLLEARMDLRLPFGGPGPGSTWSAGAMRADSASPAAAHVAADVGPEVRPAPPLEAPVPAGVAAVAAAASGESTSAGTEGQPFADRAADVAPAESEGEAFSADEAGAVVETGSAETEDEAERRSRRKRNGRRATDNFAEALARAEDPSPPELPAAAEAAAALAALREAAPPDAGDIGLPRELPAAEAVPVADETSGASAEPPAPPDGEAERPADDEAAIEPVPSADGDGVETPLGERVEAVATQPEGGDAAVGREVGEPVWDPMRYTTVIEEPDWYPEDDEPGSTVVPDAARPQPAVPDAPAAPAPSVDAPPAEAEGAPPAAGPDLEEPPAPDATVVGDAADEGTGEMATSTRGHQPMLPGSRELDEALAALDALASGGAGEPSAPAPEAVAQTASVEDEGEWPPALQPPLAPRAKSPVPTAGAAPGTLLREVRRPSVLPASPASRAYRRLRRIFPG